MSFARSVTLLTHVTSVTHAYVTDPFLWKVASKTFRTVPVCVDTKHAYAKNTLAAHCDRRLRLESWNRR